MTARNFIGGTHWKVLVFAPMTFFLVFMLSANTAAHAEQVVATIHVGSGPLAIEANPNTNRIYVADSGSGDVSVIDGSTNGVIDVISVGSGPHNIKVNPITNMIYVASSGNGINVIDGRTDTVVDTISSIKPNAIAVNTNTNTIYGSVRGTGVYVINGSNNTIVYKIPFSSNEFPLQAAVYPNTNMLYVPTDCLFCHPSYVVVINGSTNTRLMDISPGISFGDAAANPIANMIYVPDDANNYQVDVINGSINSRVAEIATAYSAGGIAVNPNTNLIYVTNGRDNVTYTINGYTNSIVGTTSVGPGPVAVAVNPNTNRIYVANMGDNTVSVLDGGSTSPDFGISQSPSPRDVNIPVGDSANTTIAVSSFYGFNGTVSLSASSQSLNTHLSPPSVTVSPGGSAQSTLTISVPSSASSGKYVVVVAGTNGTIVHYATIDVLADPVTPSAPQNLTAASISSSQVNLSWDAPAFTGGSISGYKIERLSDNGTTWSTIVSSTGSVSTAYSDTALEHSTTYTYRVSAVNPAGTSSPSNIASATTLNAPPSPPTNLSATAVSSSQINLSWNVPKDNGGTAISGYKIERLSNDGSAWTAIVADTGTPGTTYSDSGLSANATYSYRVSAINSVGASNPSDSASATTPLLTVAGTNVEPVSATLP